MEFIYKKWSVLFDNEHNKFVIGLHPIRNKCQYRMLIHSQADILRRLVSSDIILFVWCDIHCLLTSLPKLLHSSKSDNKLPRGYYAFATTWNSFLKTSGLIKCQSNVFYIVWHRSTSLCVASSNSNDVLRIEVRYICFYIFQIIVHLFISHACHISRCFPILLPR